MNAIAVGRSAESADVILEVLGDRSRVVRAKAAGMAGAYVGRRAVPRLIELLATDTKVQVRTGARRA